MKLGYVLENFGDELSPQNLVTAARYAEEMGFDSIWATDHIIRPKENDYPRFNTISESLTTIAYLAGKTEKIKVGVSTLVLPQRNPILAAKQLATISYLTNGRLSITLGAGQNEKEFSFLQQTFTNRGKRFDEQIEVMQNLWSGSNDFKGRYYSYTEALFNPKPILPIDTYIAGNSEYAIRRAIKYNFGWHPTSYPPELLVERLDQWSIKISDVPIMFRHTIMDPKDTINEIEKYQNIGINSMILRFSNGLVGLNQAKEALKSYLK